MLLFVVKTPGTPDGIPDVSCMYIVSHDCRLWGRNWKHDNRPQTRFGRESACDVVACIFWLIDSPCFGRCNNNAGPRDKTARLTCFAAF